MILVLARLCCAMCVLVRMLRLFECHPDPAQRSSQEEIADRNQKRQHRPSPQRSTGYVRCSRQASKGAPAKVRLKTPNGRTALLTRAGSTVLCGQCYNV